MVEALLFSVAVAVAGAVDASAASPDRVRERLEQRIDHRSERTLVLEERWRAANLALEVDPADEQAEQLHDRCATNLVNQRARVVRLERRLEALGEPSEEVRVFYATTRERFPRDGKWYGAKDGGRLAFGVVTVRIPTEHQVGEVERQLDVVAVDELEVDAWEAALVKAGHAAAGGLLAYVHGFNNSFRYASRRAAQISHDLEADVVPVLFSWPANGGTFFAGAKYTFDENQAGRSSLFLARFVDQVLSLDGASISTSLFAHSLGSRVLADALLDLDRSGGLPQRFDQLVFAAPDIDAWLFANRYLDLTIRASDRFTVYCARDDRALKLSRGMHGGYDRLGGCRDDAVAGLQREGVDVVDASNLYVSLLDHNKVTSSPRLLRDLGLVLAGLSTRDPLRQLMDRGDRAELPP